MFYGVIEVEVKFTASQYEIPPQQKKIKINNNNDNNNNNNDNKYRAIQLN